MIFVIKDFIATKLQMLYNKAILNSFWITYSNCTGLYSLGSHQAKNIETKVAE